VWHFWRCPRWHSSSSASVEWSAAYRLPGMARALVRRRKLHLGQAKTMMFGILSNGMSWISPP